MESSAVLAKALLLQKSAVRAFFTTAKRIVDVSALGEFKLINSVQAKLQFISHHANTSLVVLALAKAIEHTIDLNLSTSLESPAPVSSLYGPLPSGDWVASIKPLLTCLLTVDSTVSGAFTARPALQRLMQQYGDILMDCWSHGDHENF